MTLTEKQLQFEQQYAELFSYVYRYVYYRIPHAQDAEDIVSDIFLQSYKELRQFDEERGGLKQWMTGIMKRKMIDFWRKRKIVFELDETMLLFDVVDAESTAETIDHRLLLERVMEQLSPQLKALFALRYVDGLTYEEISELVSKKPEAIRKLFSRLHQKLRLQLPEQILA